MAAQIVPNPLDRVELRAVRRQLQQSDIAGHHETLAPVPTGTVQDHQGMGIAGTHVTKADDIKAAVATAFASGTPHLIEIEIEGKR